MSDKVLYLNVGDDSRLKPQLVAAIEGLPAKLQSQPAAQWIQTVKSLPSKGSVRATELDDSKLVDWLTEQGKAKLTRQEVIDHVKSTAVTVKEIQLGQPKYAGWNHVKHLKAGEYQEILFQACSEKMIVEDDLEQIEYEMEEYSFRPELLTEDPERLFALQARRKKLMVHLPMAHEYHAPHFNGQDAYGEKYAKNLFAHARVSIEPETGLFLIEEIQSDWAQNGRGRDWNGIPKGAFVTETKSWAGIVLRRLLQRAAADPRVKKVAWIRSGLHNGGMTVNVGGNHDDFYMQIVKGMADKMLKPLESRVQVASLMLGTSLIPDLCQFEMTDKVREGLGAQQPLYSKASLLPKSRVDLQGERSNWAHLAGTARQMLGSRVQLQLLDRLYDIATCQPVAGRLVGHTVMLNLAAADKEFVFNHECWHYADQHLLTAYEQRLVESEFAPGSPLNMQVRDLLLQRGDGDAARQCVDAKEAAAHGFALFVRGDLDVRPTPVRGLFAQVWQAFQDVAAWVRQGDRKRMEATDLYTLFEGVRSGQYSPEFVPLEEEEQADGPEAIPLAQLEQAVAAEESAERG